MLNALDSSPQGCHNPILADSVRCHDTAAPRSLLHNGLDLGRRELRVLGLVVETHDAPRRANLDHLGAVADDLPRLTDALIHAVAQRKHLAPELAPVAHQVQRAVVLVAVPARYAQRRQRRVHRRPHHEPLVDHGPQVARRPAQLTHRRKPRHQRLAQVFDQHGTHLHRRAGQKGPRRLLHGEYGVRAGKVRVHVPEAGHQRGAELGMEGDMVVLARQGRGVHAHPDDGALGGRHDHAAVGNGLPAARDEHLGVHAEEVLGVAATHLVVVDDDTIGGGLLRRSVRHFHLGVQSPLGEELLKTCR